MKKKILDFIAELRKKDIRVSVSESQDVLNSILFPELIANKKLFKQILQCSLIKNIADVDEFDLLFNLFFLKNLNYNDIIEEIEKKQNDEQRDILRKAAKDRRNSLKEQIDKSKSQNQKLQDLLKEVESNKELSSLTKALATENISRLDNLIDEKINLLMRKWSKSPLRKKSTYEKNVIDSFDWFKVDSELDELYYQAISEESIDLQKLINKIEKNKKQFKKLIEETIEYTDTENRPRDRGWERHSGKDKIYDSEWICKTPFDKLSSQESKLLFLQIQRLAKILATKVSRRQKLCRQQKIINIRNTMRKSIEFGGIPIKISYKKKKLQKNDIILICDVSGSVIKPAKFLLHFMYLLQSCIQGKIRSFIFVSKIDEVTSFFQDREIKEAINLAMGDANVDYRGRSDFGAAFASFTDRYLNIINSKTTVIIIGDARTNGRNPQIDKLQEIKNKAKRLIWLNPEDKNKWNTSDSIVNIYKPLSHELHEVKDFNSLEKFVNTLML